MRALRNAAERYAFDLDGHGGTSEIAEVAAQPLAALVEAYERDVIRQALQQAQGNVAETMRLLDLLRRTLIGKCGAADWLVLN